MSYPSYNYQPAQANEPISSTALVIPRQNYGLKVSSILIMVLLLIALAVFKTSNHTKIHSFLWSVSGHANVAALSNLNSSEDNSVETETLYETNFKASLNESEKDVIDLLRTEVKSNITHSFMTTDSYLIRWLRARDWDVEEAKKMLLEHLDWRKAYDMDNVLTDNLTFFENDYPFYMDGYDYLGGPVASMNVGDWDLRKIATAGLQHDFLRYAFSHFEKGIKYISACQVKGQNISQALLVMNLEKFSMRIHGCYACLPTLYKFVFGLDDNYPGWLHHFLLINVPDIAEEVLDLLIPYLSGENKEAFKIYGFNKLEWQAKILSLVSAEQIRPEFGGTKVDHDDI